MIKKIKEFCIHFFQIIYLVNYCRFYQKILNTFNSKLSFIEIWFTDQKRKLDFDY